MMFALTDDDGRILALVNDEEYAGEKYFKFDIPDDFDIESHYEYRIEDGRLIHDPTPPSEEELECEREKLYKSQLEQASVLLIQENAKTLSDKIALSVSMLFEIWQPNIEYIKNDIVRYKDNIYRIGQNHKSQKQWVPGENGTESLYSLIFIDEGGYEVWKKFDGVSGVYKEGQIVKDPNDGKLYKSKIPSNVWGPPHDTPSYWELYTG